MNSVSTRTNWQSRMTPAQREEWNAQNKYLSMQKDFPNYKGEGVKKSPPAKAAMKKYKGTASRMPQQNPL